MTLALPTLQRTPLFKWHQSHGAKIVDFSGWEMPLQYGKVLEEHLCVRNAAGLFDISHMGLVLVQGELERVRAFLDSLVPQDLSKLVPGKAVYTQFLTETGGILDDIIVYQLPEKLENEGFRSWEGFLIIVNAGNRQVDMGWLVDHAPTGISIHLASDTYGLLALQGPSFSKILAAVGCRAEDLPKRFWLNPAQLQTHKGPIPVLLSRTGYTGEDGVEIIVPTAHITSVWENLLKAGAPAGCRPIGLAARDTLRLEAAYPLHGHDIHPQVTPLEAGLDWSVKLEKPADFIGKAALQNPGSRSQQAICLTLNTRHIPRQHDLIFSEAGELLGEVTSGSISPTLGYPIAMALVNRALIADLGLKMGSSVWIEIRGKRIKAIWAERPFYKRV